MTGEAYAQSARIARDCGGPFAGYARNEQPFLRVMRKHRDALKNVSPAHVPADLQQAAADSWNDVVELGEKHGFRQRAGHRARADRHHRLHDGLRHDRRWSRTSRS